jgi:hypothetical protein
MDDFAKRLARRLEEEICRVCVHQTSDGGCTLTERRDCPVFEWAERLALMVGNLKSNLMADYLAEIQKVICPDCTQKEDGSCADRDHLDCPLDLYLGIVLQVFEDELAKTPAAEMPHAEEH